ncbi:MAG: hypothetical protein KatS3mg065_0691 [Chloroflexota bacterium]|nr:MAG: hypothetical protein KatS3mg065_0691 [Chloroflexota bacterium]
MFDTVKGGDYLVDQDAAEVLAREAIETVIELEHMGLPFNRTPDGRIDQRRFGGHTRNFGEAPVRRAVLRRRPHRPHDPPDPLPAVHASTGCTSTTSSTSWTSSSRAATGLTAGERQGRRLRIADGELHAFHAEGGHARHRRLRPDVPR